MKGQNKKRLLEGQIAEQEPIVFLLDTYMDHFICLGSSMSMVMACILRKDMVQEYIEVKASASFCISRVHE
jgi:hypothetical protein